MADIPPQMKTLLRHLLLASLVLGTFAANATQTDIAGPPGSGSFGTSVTALPNGNIVVTDPFFDEGATLNVGAVHLYSPTGVLISTLKGSTAEDQISSSGLLVLTSGNFLVLSPLWDNGAAADAGAVTFVNGTTGLNAVVGPANSLVGSKAGDSVGGISIAQLTNGNYVVRSTVLDNGAVADAGAVTWGSGTTGVAGVISAANSLIGSTASDQIGNNGLIALSNGNYLVLSAGWDNGAASNAGAATWCDGSTGRTGTISPANSLVGSSASDGVGSGVTVLTNGNYVVRTVLWDNGAVADAGAATWGSGTTGVAGVISAANSLVGTTANDRVGSVSVTALTNDNYVVLSSDWNNGATTDVGAATWGNGSTGMVGAVGPANSLIGSTASDQVGRDGVLVLTNGNYVVRSSNWNNGAATTAGAATWCSGTGPTSAVVSTSNSLFGTTAGDNVGLRGLAVGGGNYVVGSPFWNNGATVDVGAATFCNGSTGTTGAVSTSNSLIGSTLNDKVGDVFTPLTNGTFVTRTISWDNGVVADVGAVTYGSATAGLPLGAVSAANSLIGSTAGDQVGSTGITALTNGNYIVRSGLWDNGTAVDAGAVTWGNGNAGVVGIVSPLNSLVGSTASDSVVNVQQLTNGNYVVVGSTWDNGSAVNAGAAVWANGTTGITGVVSPANALVGSQAGDTVSIDGLVALANGIYLVRSGDRANGAASKAGAVTFGNGATGITGPVTTANSLVGSTANDQLGFTGGVVAFSDSSYRVTASTWDNGAVVDSGAVTTSFFGQPVFGPVTAANSVLGTAANGGLSLFTAYDVARAQFIVGRKSDNKFTIVTNDAAGKVSFDAALITLNESAGVVPITVRRAGGTVGSLSVTLSSANGTALAGSDYVAIAPQLLTFAPGEATKTVNVTILPDGIVNEANETFTLKLAGLAANLGTIPTTTVRIIDAIDSTNPALPIITAPAANARIGVNAGGKVNITGTATDNKGIAKVQVRINGGTFTDATLTTNAGTAASWTIALAPKTGANLIEVQSTDTLGGLSPIATRTFVCTRPLVVRPNGANGIFTAGFAPSSFREPGKLCTVTATAPAGFLFVNWSIVGGANAQGIGVNAAQLELPTLSFIFRESLTLVANFAANPYLVTGVVGTYNGNIHADPALPDRAPAGAGPEDGTLPSVASEGSISIVVANTGGFTGKLNIDGLSLPISGTFDAAGKARFGAQRTLTLSVPRTGKTSLILQLSLNTTLHTITGSVTDLNIAVSNITGDRAHWNGTTLIPTDLLGAANANGIFNTFAFPLVPPAGLTIHEFPRGYGVSTLTVTKAGAVSIGGVLSEGTPFTASGTLDQNKVWHLFIPLYGKRGLLTGDLTFNTSIPDRDVDGPLTWLRPILDDQHYPGGWPDGFGIFALGTKFTPPALGTSVLPGITQPATEPDGNANFIPDFGPLAGPLFLATGITGADVTTNKSSDPGFTLTLDRKTGKFSGAFTLGSTKPAFQGIILNKGTTKTARGFFKTVIPKVKDYTGEAGAVFLDAQ